MNFFKKTNINYLNILKHHLIVINYSKNVNLKKKYNIYNALKLLRSQI